MKKKRELSPFEQRLNDFVANHLTRIPFVQKIFFVDHMRTMIHAGLSLIEALRILSKEISNKKFKMIIDEIKRDVEKGQQISEVLAKHPKVFPPIYVKMIESGEVSGKLEEALEQVVVQMKKTQQLTSSIRSAMIYPSVIIFAMGGIGVMMATVVLPKLVDLFKDFDAELPLATRVLIYITDFVSKPLNLIIIIVFIFLSLTIFITSIKKYPKFKHFIHNLNLHLPIFGKIIKKINLARFSLTLSSLLRSTISIIDAVGITADTCSNVLYREALKTAQEKIKTGTPLSEILANYDNLFPPMVTEMIMVGEKTGEVDQLLNELAVFYNDEVDKTLKNFTTIIEPVIIITIGIVVAGLAVAVIMPMYTLVQNF
jgi:type IV pilus assembly protein PilC